MKKTKNNIISILLLLAIAIVSCNENNSINGAGASTLPNDDIKVMSDTFAVSSHLDSCVAISLTPDSFLLGECDTHFGTIKADILTQLACPEGFEYPNETAEIDSVCLYLYYNSWHGDGNSPLGITVYEMDKKTLKDNELYKSTLQISDYCSLNKSTNIATESKIIIPANYTDSSYSSKTESYTPTIRIKLSDEFAQRFFKIKDFSSQKAFNELFKGLYIKTDFGASNLLYVSDITMTVFYHFTMQRPQMNDTAINDTRAFYANEEVRQVNRYTYPNRQTILNKYSQIKDTNYIVSPANIYTELSVRIDSIHNKINSKVGDDDYRVYVNKADLTVDVLYSDSVTGRPRDSWDKPASYMMLIQKDNMSTFFSKNEMPSDSVAIIAALTASADSLDNVSYKYTYDLSTLLTHYIRNNNQVETISFVLVPVAVQTNSSTGAVQAVKPLQTISATRIRSSNNPDIPMNIEMVYSGFSKTRQGQ